MKDSSNNIRQVYLSALDGNITYNGQDVKVYGELPFETPYEQYIIISSITETDDNNNHRFSNKVDVTIDIFVQQYRDYSNAAVDNIAGQVLNILLPDPQINNIGDSDFEVYPMARISSRYLPLEDGQNFTARKIITITNLVNQK